MLTPCECVCVCVCSVYMQGVSGVTSMRSRVTRKEVAEVRGSPAVAGQRCPVKQMALSVQVLGSDAVALGSESSLATRGRGSLEPFRKSESGSAARCRQGHHCSHSPAVTRAAHPERTLPLWGGSYYVVPTSQGGHGGRGDGTCLLYTSPSPRDL